MSSGRGRNKFCLSLDHSTSTTSNNTAHLHRWSEVVPPKTALTFAALWDPDEGMVTFSGAALLEPEGSSHADVFDDDYSQFISLDRDTDGGGTTDENTATLSTFQDVFKAFLRHTPWDSREHLNTKPGQNAPRGSQTRASSTFDGLDVYSHDVQVKPRRSLQLSCIDLLEESASRAPSAFGRLRLKSDVMLEPCRSVESESGNKSLHQHSRFSTTTTSTSNYVDVTGSAHQSIQIHISETLPVPEWPPLGECTSPASPAGSWPFLPRRRRVLRKRRPFDSDTATSISRSPLSTPRKVTPKSSSISPSSFPCSPSPSAVAFSSTATFHSGNERDRRGRFTRLIASPISAVPTPPDTPSKSPLLKLRFAFLNKRKSRRTSSDSDGWVCIDVTPYIRERFIADPTEDRY